MKRTKLLSLALPALMAIAFMTACDSDDNSTDNIAIEISENDIDLVVGQTFPLSVTVTPENLSDKSVTWVSNTPAIASVDENGVVTAHSLGQAIIAVTTTQGRKTARCNVTVHAENIPVSGVRLNHETLDIPLGESDQLEATVLPENALNKRVTWSSGDETVATVNSDGLVRALSLGKAVITVTTVEGEKTADCEVTVVPPPALKLYLDGYTGSTVKVTYDDDTVEDALKITDGEFDYPESRSKLIKSIELDGGAVHYIGRPANSAYTFRISGTDIAFRDAVGGAVPIGSYAEFQHINSSDEAKAGNYIQEADIDFMSVDWTPVGAFLGTFDGDGFTISNILIDNEGLNEAGLFSHNAGTIKNVHVASGSVKAGSSVGGIAGYNRGTIDLCSNKADINGNGAAVGGIAGTNEDGIVRNSFNTGNVMVPYPGPGENVAGICGMNVNGASVIACYNTGAISGDHHAAGIVGIVFGGNTNLIACYNTGSVTGPGAYSFAGICGLMNSVDGSDRIEACYSTGAIGVAGTWDCGGICGRNRSGSIVGCYWTGIITANDGPYGIGALDDLSPGDSRTDDNAWPMSAAVWPTTDTSPAWGTGNGETNGYWKTLGSASDSQYPKLWFEE